MDERKITIIEGPPPTFEAASDGWAWALVEGPSLRQIAVTQVRALNGAALVERCYRAWKQREPIHLEFRSAEGLIQKVPIVAAHYGQIDDVDVLRLWVAVDNDDIQVNYEFVDADEEDDLTIEEIEAMDVDNLSLDMDEDLTIDEQTLADLLFGDEDFPDDGDDEDEDEDHLIGGLI